MKRIFITGISFVVSMLIFACNGIKKENSQNDENHAQGADSHTHSKYFGAYDLEDENFGTKTKVSLTADERIMATNSLPNHKTGDFPNEGNPNTISAQNRTFKFPLEPKYTGKAQWIREPGIAVNGIKFEPGTAEVVACESGENYRVEAFQEVIDMGLDFNHAHVQPTGAYHYHGSPTSVIENDKSQNDLVHIGFAHDGFPMYYSKRSVYKSSFKLIEGNREGDDCSYERPGVKIDLASGGHHDGTFTSDYEYVEGYGDLDECNGITIDGKYMYLVTNEFPYVSRCLMGEFAEEKHGGPPPHGEDAQRPEGKLEGKPQGSQAGRPQGSGPGGQPTALELIENMDADKDGKLSMKEVKGPLKQDYSKIDTDRDGFISRDELEKGKK